MNTGFGLWIIEEKLGLVILLRYRVVRPDGYRTKRIMVCRDPNAQHRIINDVNNCRTQYDRNENALYELNKDLSSRSTPRNCTFSHSGWTMPDPTSAGE